MTIPYTSTTYEHQGLERCDNPGLGKHLVVNTFTASGGAIALHDNISQYIGALAGTLILTYHCVHNTQHIVYCLRRLNSANCSTTLRYILKLLQHQIFLPLLVAFSLL